MLILNHLSGFGGASKSSATVTYIGGSGSTADSTSYTYSSVSIGTASSDRLVVVVGSGYGAASAALTLSSVTLDGVAMTVAVKYDSAGTGHPASVIAYKAVPSGTTADIVFTYSPTAGNHYHGVYTITGWSSLVPTTKSDTSNPFEAPLSLPRGGAVIGVANANSSSSTNHTWPSFMTENLDANQESIHSMGWASYNSRTRETANVTCTFASGGSALIAAAWS